MSLRDDLTINERDPLLSSFDQRQEYNTSNNTYKFNNNSNGKL